MNTIFNTRTVNGIHQIICKGSFDDKFYTLDEIKYKQMEIFNLQRLSTNATYLEHLDNLYRILDNMREKLLIFTIKQNEFKP